MKIHILLPGALLAVACTSVAAGLSARGFTRHIESTPPPVIWKLAPASGYDSCIVLGITNSSAGGGPLAVGVSFSSGSTNLSIDSAARTAIFVGSGANTSFVGTVWDLSNMTGTITGAAAGPNSGSQCILYGGTSLSGGGYIYVGTQFSNYFHSQPQTWQGFAWNTNNSTATYPTQTLSYAFGITPNAWGFVGQYTSGSSTLAYAYCLNPPKGASAGLITLPTHNSAGGVAYQASTPTVLGALKGPIGETCICGRDAGFGEGVVWNIGYSYVYGGNYTLNTPTESALATPDYLWAIDSTFASNVSQGDYTAGRDGTNLNPWLYDWNDTTSYEILSGSTGQAYAVSSSGLTGGTYSEGNAPQAFLYPNGPGPGYNAYDWFSGNNWTLNGNPAATTNISSWTGLSDITGFDGAWDPRYLVGNVYPGPNTLASSYVVYDQYGL